MKLALALGRLDIDRVLGCYPLSSITGDEAEELDVFVKVFEGKVGAGIGFKIVKPESCKIGDDNVIARERKCTILDFVQSKRHLEHSSGFYSVSKSTQINTNKDRDKGFSNSFELRLSPLDR